MKKVLVVEDSLLSRRFIRLALGSWPDIQVLEARDGEEGWALLQREQVDLVLTDQHMPGIDGLELIRRLRAAAAPLCDVPVVVITSAGEAQALVAARDVGASDYICKPVQAGELQPILDRYLSAPPPAREGEAGPAPAGLLLASPGWVRAAIKRQLEEVLAAQVLEATNSLEALGQLFLHDLRFMVVDLRTADQQGLVFMDQLDARRTYATIPVVVLADHSTRNDLAELGDPGAVVVVDGGMPPSRIGALVAEAVARQLQGADD